MSDLAEQILAAISTAEHTGRFGDAPVGFFVGGAEYHPDDVEIVYESGRAESDAVLRRCTADREIVALHVLKRDFYCSECGIPDEYPVRWPCPTLRALARGYGLEET
jgi:hypothetical protein